MILFSSWGWKYIYCVSCRAGGAVVDDDDDGSGEVDVTRGMTTVE